jgi:hypothetical protein
MTPGSPATLLHCIAVAEDVLAGFVLKAVIDEIYRDPVNRDGHVWMGRSPLVWYRELGLTAKELWVGIGDLGESGLVDRKICRPGGKFSMLLRPTANALTAIALRQKGFSTDWAELEMAPGVH